VTPVPEPHPALPLSEQTYNILLSLFQGPQHGYGILKDIQQLSDGRLLISVSTLYTTLKRLLEQGWIERAEPEEQDDAGHPRKIYKLTPTGRRFLLGETERMQKLIQAANQRIAQQSS
jgi:DNA-binding PadR family transcriptional regulator